jgi:hypothetical protein
MRILYTIFQGNAALGAGGDAKKEGRKTTGEVCL